MVIHAINPYVFLDNRDMEILESPRLSFPVMMVSLIIAKILH